MLHNYLHCLCTAKNKMLRSKAACDKPLLVAAEVFTFLSLLLEFPVTSVALNSNSGEHCWSSQPLPLSSPLLSSPAGDRQTRLALRRLQRPVRLQKAAGKKQAHGCSDIYEMQAQVVCLMRLWCAVCHTQTHDLRDK